MSSLDSSSFPLFDAAYSQEFSFQATSSGDEIAESPWRADDKVLQLVDLQDDEEIKEQGKHTIFLGNANLLPFLRKALQNVGISADIELSGEGIVWVRDSHVIRPDGSFLLPAYFNVKDFWWTALFGALLPQEMDHFISEERHFLGHGSSIAYQEEAERAAQNVKRASQHASTCIEGGNCYIFTAEDGKPKAIVGYISVIVSLIRFIALKRFGTFEELLKNSNALKNFGEDPKCPPLDNEALRIGRNVYRHLQGKFYKDTREPFLEPGKPKWIQMARSIQNMIFLTKEKMAQELQIPLDRVAFVFQERFHIDMELFPASRDIVFLHDESITKKIIEEFNPSFQNYPFLTRTLSYSKSHQLINEKIVTHNISALEKIGCKALRVPGVLTATFERGETLCYREFLHNWTKKSAQSSSSLGFDEVNGLQKPEFLNMLNFMNGMYFDQPSPVFITNGTKKKDPIIKRFTEAFQEAIHKAFSELKILMVEIGSELTEKEGGLRCTTSVLSVS